MGWFRRNALRKPKKPVLIGVNHGESAKYAEELEKQISADKQI